MYKVIITGVNGSMGQVLSRTLTDSGAFTVAAGVDISPEKLNNPFPVFPAIADCTEKADIVIDFSRPGALDANLTYALAHNLPLVIATTGYSAEQKQQIAEAAQEIPIFFTANMSLGVNLQMELCRLAAGFFGGSADIEIVERHHNLKADAPSGTALVLAEVINKELHNAMEYQFGRHGLDTRRKPNEIGIHSLRGGRIVGEHDVYFITNEEVLQINHHADSKQVFAAGALRAAIFLLGCPVGLYSMHDILGGEKEATNVQTTCKQAIITLYGIPWVVGSVARIFKTIADKNVNLDIINQSVPTQGRVEVSFSLSEEDLPAVEACIMDSLAQPEYIVQRNLVKITVEGIGMKNSFGVAARLFSALASSGVDVLIVTTSETKISFCVESAQKNTAVESVNKAFGL